MKKILLSTLFLATLINANADSIYVNAAGEYNSTWGNYALGLNGGYEINRNLSAEVGYTYSPGYSYYYDNGSTFNTAYSMFDLVAKASLPLTDSISIFGKAGPAYNHYASWNGCNNCSGPTYSGNSYGIYYGGGIDLASSSVWDIHIEDYTVTGNNPNFVSAGLTYKF